MKLTSVPECAPGSGSPRSPHTASRSRHARSVVCPIAHSLRSLQRAAGTRRSCRDPPRPGRPQRVPWQNRPPSRSASRLPSASCRRCSRRPAWECPAATAESERAPVHDWPSRRCSSSGTACREFACFSPPDPAVRCAPASTGKKRGSRESNRSPTDQPPHSLPRDSTLSATPSSASRSWDCRSGSCRTRRDVDESARASHRASASSRASAGCGSRSGRLGTSRACRRDSCRFRSQSSSKRHMNWDE